MSGVIPSVLVSGGKGISQQLSFRAESEDVGVLVEMRRLSPKYVTPRCSEFHAYGGFIH